MPVKIVLELTDEDLSYFRRVMDSVWKRNAKRAEKELLDGARRLLRQRSKLKAPEYVQSRLDDVKLLLELLDDDEWPLDEEDRRRILAAVGYFAIPRDMIPDKIPGIGLLDDAVMAELVARDLKHDLDGYRDFCKYRENAAESRGKNVSRGEWLEAKRRQIVLRIKRRQQEGQLRHGSKEGPTPAILRYQY